MNNSEIGYKLAEIYDEVLEKMKEARKLVRQLPEGVTRQRAEQYWLPHILMALNKDHTYLGGSMFTMADTIAALEDNEEQNGNAD